MHGAAAMLTAAPSGVWTTLVSIVLPVHRQADHLAGIVRAYEASLSRIGVPFELILVVNGPSDASITVARQLESAHRYVRVLETRTARWGHAVKLGLAAAKGDLICYTNSARTTGEDLALVLIYAMAYPGVVIKVNRRVRDSLSRRIGSLVYNLQCRMLFDLSCWDLNGTPKAFPRTCDKLLALERDDDLIDLEFNIVCHREGYRMLEVPILATHRHGGQSTTNLRTAFFLYWGAFRLWRLARQDAPTREKAPAHHEA
jgi:undecaprenyl-phosphate 4-deoxy-4-formamido-L-arabinose transferase